MALVLLCSLELSECFIGLRLPSQDFMLEVHSQSIID